jgi:uncharacterized membrane protein
MNVAAASRARESHWPLIIVLTALAAALLWFLAGVLHYATDYSQTSYSPYFWPRRAGLIPHLAGGMLAITCGLVQLWLGLSNRVGALHRALGKLYGVGVLTGSLGGFYLALTIPGSLSYSAGLVALCFAWLLTTGMALYAIRTRRIEQHREWMLRSYTVTFAFVTFRLCGDLVTHWGLLPRGVGRPDLDAILAWGCWSVPLLLAEPLIQLRAMRRVRARG